jgi:hypothetical protein
VRIRFLFAMLIAMALAMTPLAMPAGAAMAAVPDHHAAMGAHKTGAEHCPDTPKPSHPIQADKSCCVAGCMAVAALPAPADDPAIAGSTRERPSPDRFRRGYLGEIATPPPRLA